MIKIYFLFVVGNGTSPSGTPNHMDTRGIPVKCAIATPDYATHVAIRKHWIDKGYNVSTKDKDMNVDQWNSIKDVF